MKKKLLGVAVSLALAGPLALAAGQGGMGPQQSMGPQMMRPGGAGMAQMPMMQQMQAMLLERGYYGLGIQDGVRETGTPKGSFKATIEGYPCRVPDLCQIRPERA